MDFRFVIEVNCVHESIKSNRVENEKSVDEYKSKWWYLGLDKFFGIGNKEYPVFFARPLPPTDCDDGFDFNRYWVFKIKTLRKTEEIKDRGNHLLEYFDVVKSVGRYETREKAFEMARIEVERFLRRPTC